MANPSLGSPGPVVTSVCECKWCLRHARFVRYWLVRSLPFAACGREATDTMVMRCMQPKGTVTCLGAKRAHTHAPVECQNPRLCGKRPPRPVDTSADPAFSN